MQMKELATSPQKLYGEKFIGTRTLFILKIIIFIGIVVALNYAVALFSNLIRFQMWPRHMDSIHLIILVSIGVYIILLALPFMPGIEVGLMLMILLGREGIFIVYLCTIFSLSLSFLFGRALSPRVIAGILGWFYLYKAQKLFLQLQYLTPEDRLQFLLKAAPSKIIPFLLKHRYLIIAILFNLPGNAFIGGGGGIGAIAGNSRLFSFSKYILVVCFAITPVPLIFLIKYTYL